MVSTLLYTGYRKHFLNLLDFKFVNDYLDNLRILILITDCSQRHPITLFFEYICIPNTDIMNAQYNELHIFSLYCLNLKIELFYLL